MWSGWDVLLVAGLGFLATVVLQLAVLLGARLWFYPHADMAFVARQAIVLLVSQILVFLAIAAFMVMVIVSRYHMPFWSAIRWNWPRPEWKMLAVGAVMFVALGFLESILPMPKDTPFEHLFDKPLDAYLISILAVSVGPLIEELFFRGMLYPVLARRFGMVWGVLLSALPFGLLHLPQYGWAWAAALVIFLVGVVCGAVRAVTDSVGASFLVHVGYNGTQMLIALVATHGFQHLDKPKF